MPFPDDFPEKCGQCVKSFRQIPNKQCISAEVLLKEPGGSFPEEVQDMEWHKFPVVEMVKRCWIPKAKDIKENVEELMRNFISQAAPSLGL